MKHDRIRMEALDLRATISAMSDAEKLALIIDLLNGSIDMGEALSDALIPLDHCLDANLNSLRAAVEE